MTQTITGTSRIRFGGQLYQIELTVPTEPVKPSTLLPLFRRFADIAVDAAARNMAEEGRAISCKAGCGACCCQLVPIRRMEARRLAAMVEAMQEPRRSEIIARFRDAERRYIESGLPAEREEKGLTTPEAIISYGSRYFHLGIPCPFLEEGSCSIYEERPIVCREYLVTSHPDHCATLNGRALQPVSIAKTSHAVAMIERAAGRVSLPWVALTTILTWAADNPEEETAPRPGPELLRDFLENVTGDQVPAAPTML